MAHRPNKAQKSALRGARIILRLWPAPHSTACIASPKVPLSQLRRSSPSFFMCPIIGSMALRRLSKRLALGLRPRVLAISTLIPVGNPRSPL